MRDSCGKSVYKETPQTEAEEAPETARENRVPDVEITVQIVQTHKKL